jgi:hypothetical protein
MQVNHQRLGQMIKQAIDREPLAKIAVEPIASSTAGAHGYVGRSMSSASRARWR